MTLDHGKPVEACLALPGGALLLSAGGNELRVWDLLAGGKLLHSFANHQKTITSLCLDGTGTRVLTGSLDQHVKVYDLHHFSVTHGMKYNAPIMTIAVSPDNSRLVAGMVDGTLEIRQKDSKSLTDLAGHDIDDDDDSAKTKQILRGGTYKYFLRGKNSVPSADDYKVMVQRKARLKAYDRAFRKFQVHHLHKMGLF
jgi:U3 small nucleolar RNA-associated protein 15